MQIISQFKGTEESDLLISLQAALDSQFLESWHLMPTEIAEK